MDDDAEDGARMRFSMDADYEGGEWVGGEYFFSKKKQKRAQTRDDALYGVFNESDSDDAGAGGKKGRRRRKDDDVISKGDLSKPVAFVSKGVSNPNEELEKQQQQQQQQQQEAETASRAEEATQPGLGFTSGLGYGGAGLGASRGGGEDAAEEEDALSKSAFGQQIKERAEKRKESERERLQEEKRLKALGQSTARWAGESAAGLGSSKAKLEIPKSQQQGKGIGFKLLEKMGYKGGGLGKNAQGITQPIEARMRPKNMGMGFNDFKEKEVGLPARPGAEAEAAEGEVKFDASGALGEGAQKKEQLWKKKGASRRKVEYKTAAQLLEEKQAAGGEVATQKILDMRGTQVRVLTSLDNLSAEHKAAQEEEEDTPMPELQHNLRLLVDLAEADIQTLDKRLRAERASLVVLQEEKERAWARAEEHQEQLRSMEAIVKVLDSLEAARKLPDQQKVIAAFRGLKDTYEDDYRLFNIAAVALTHAQPLIAGLLQGWNPLTHPRQGLIEVAMWQEVLSYGDAAADRAIFSDIAAQQSADPYLRLVANCVLPHVRSAVTNLWEPREPELLLRFIEDWRAALPEALMKDILDNLVMPKLAAAVNSWNPLQETIPIHQWLHPWLPFLGTAMQVLYPTIQYRLGSVLHAWHPSDTSALAMLGPWRTVFQAAAWEALVVRSILPKLVQMMRSEFVVNPQQQILEPFKWAMAWAGVAPAHHMVALLDASFFPQWHQVLYHWLCASPNFDEVTRWYLGWKSLMPEELLSQERVRQQLNVALDMMNQAVEGAPVVQPGAREHVSYLRSSEHQAFLSGAAGGAAAGAKNEGKVGGGAAVDVEMEGGPSAGEMSLREVLEMFAQQHDVKFLPKPGRVHEGLPVYSFGTVSVVTDAAKQLILAQNQDHVWEPVTMQGLLEQHRKRGGRWAV